MAKFCTICGKPLVEGQPCACQNKENDAVALSSAAVRNYANLFIETVKGMFTKPIDTIKKYSTSKNFGFGVIACMIASLVMGIFLYSLLTEAIDMLQMGTFLSLYGGYEVSLIKVVLMGFIYGVVGYTVTVAMIYLIAGILMKTNISFKKITACVGVCSVITTITTFASIIAIYLSFNLAAIILCIGMLFYLVYLYQGISEITTVNKNKLAYVYVPTLCAVMVVVTYVLPRILG